MQIWSTEIKELEKLYESFRGQLPYLEKELERLVKADDENMILLYSRRCLEIIITDLCECELKRPRKTEPLQGIIDKLHKEEKIPSHIISSMHGLNELSTYGAHPKDFDPRQVRTTLINLETIIGWYLLYKGIKIKGEVEKVGFGGEISEGIKKEAGIGEQGKRIKLAQSKLLSGVLITAILVIVGIIAYQKIFKRDSLESLREKGEISVAVIPFQNMTNDTIWTVWQNGIQNELINYLTNSEELKVRQTESINNLIQSKGFTNYASITPSVASNISQKLDANVFICGSLKQAGSTLRLSAQLIDTRTEEVFKTFQIEDTAKEGNIFRIIDSLSEKVKNFLIITVLEKELTQEYHPHMSTNSPEAYRYFLNGKNAYFKTDYFTARNLLLQALAIDSNLFAAKILIPFSYGNQGNNTEARKWAIKVYEGREKMPIMSKIWTDIVYSNFFETPYEEIKYLKQSLEIDDQSPTGYFQLGMTYLYLNQHDKAIPEFEKSLEIFNKWEIKPMWVYSYINLGWAYHETGQYKKEKKLYKKAEQEFPDEVNLIRRQAILSLTEGDGKEAKDYIDKYISILKENSASEADITNWLAEIYSEAGILDKAEEYYRQALTLEPGNPDKLNYLAYFLIYKERNIDEGLNLIDRVLELNPDNYNYLHTKGWGFYKQGKYQEASEILQKSWDLRREKAIYDHEAYLHLEAAKKAAASQKNN